MSGLSVSQFPVSLTNNWESIEATFEIPAPHRNAIDLSDGLSQTCAGYENCVYAVRLNITCDENDTIYLANPILERI